MELLPIRHWHIYIFKSRFGFEILTFLLIPQKLSPLRWFSSIEILYCLHLFLHYDSHYLIKQVKVHFLDKYMKFNQPKAKNTLWFSRNSKTDSSFWHLFVGNAPESKAHLKAKNAKRWTFRNQLSLNETVRIFSLSLEGAIDLPECGRRMK